MSKKPSENTSDNASGNVIEPVRKAPKKGSKKARRSAARLNAVQIIYQTLLDHKDIKTVIRDHLESDIVHSVDGEPMVTPDDEMLSHITQGVVEKRADIDQALRNVKDASKLLPTGKLLQAILMCGCFEIVYDQKTDAPIVIADYLNVTHAFYDKSEAKLVNGVLDKLYQTIKDETGS